SRLWHFPAEEGCPRSRRVLEGKRTSRRHVPYIYPNHPRSGLEKPAGAHSDDAVSAITLRSVCNKLKTHPSSFGRSKSSKTQGGERDQGECALSQQLRL